MSLSTQLTRGTLALPMLALFGALALAANKQADAQAAAPQARAAAAAIALSQAKAVALLPKAEAALARIVIDDARGRVLIVRVGEGTGCHALPRKTLLLAQAPGDLGPIAQRVGEDCRA